MKGIWFKGVLILLVLLVTFCLSGCRENEEIHFQIPKSYEKKDMYLSVFDTYEIPLQGISDAYIYNEKIYMCNNVFNRIDCYSKDLAFLMSFGKTGSRAGELLSPERIWVDDEGVHILDWGNRRIALFSHDGEFIKTLPITGTFSKHVYLGGMCKTKGLYWISLAIDNFDSKVIILSDSGKCQTLCADGMGDFFVNNNEVYLLTQAGRVKNRSEVSLNSNKSGEIGTVKFFL